MSDLRTYLDILKSTMLKKESVLQALYEACVVQKELIAGDELDYDRFHDSMDQKDALLEQLDELDQGFEKVFEDIKRPLKEQKETYKKDIEALQDQVRACTSLGVEIERLEQMNKKRLEVVFAGEKKELRRVKTSTKVASNYYKTMQNLHNIESRFMDQKK